ncbi:phosphoenolpyruvate synthase [Candidatus Woesearchaeota archaeon]|nr:phosphoenolpyruvate synthase [Candidatus Woesearchaeota archaeon]
MKRSDKFILWFKELSIDDVPLVGGKNASLGEMYRELTSKGVKIPNGFAVTATAYRFLLDKAGIEKNIKSVLKGLDTHSIRNLSSRGHKIREIIRTAEFPDELRKEVVEAYKKLCKRYGPNTDVAVRSSATAEDLPTASFAGQQETYLNIRGEHALIEACKNCFASLFTNRAISYREDKGFDHFKVALSIGVQKMVRSDKATSGVMFSIDTESGFKEAVFITAAYGLGENVVQGAVNPDEYYVFKPTLKKGFDPILSKKLGSKAIRMIYDLGGNAPTKNIPVTVEDRMKYALSDKEVLLLAKWACVIEDHYSRKAKKPKPMDMEWAKDGITNELFIVQARPETVMSQKRVDVLEEYKLSRRGEILVVGSSVGSKIGAGKVNVIKDVSEIERFRKGQVLVTEMTDPDWEPIMKIASAIVTNRGGRTCHAAIVSRELGIPCVVGTENATDILKSGQKVTVSCAEGEEGFVYKGFLKYKVEKHNIKNLKRPKTKMMMNLGNPEQAFALSFIPNDGIGLAREEFIINSYIKIHPLALLNFGRLKDKDAKKKIADITYGYKDKSQYYVDKLSEGVATIAAAFYPKDVIVRLSDFKSNEYANLIGGKEFEPVEHNPMIGFRGASRFYSEMYKKAFGLECKALKKVRDKMGLANVKLMIPMCRTIEEGKLVLNEMKRNGLVRGKNKLQVYVMCEIPSNVMLMDEFCKYFDGFSIGSNDLTQLTLGVDRDSELVAHVYDERNLAVKKMVALAISKAKSHHRKIGICGEAASRPDFARFLIRQEIDSLSMAPDALLKITLQVLKDEQRLKRK